MDLRPASGGCQGGNLVRKIKAPKLWVQGVARGPETVPFFIVLAPVAAQLYLGQDLFSEYSAHHPSFLAYLVLFLRFFYKIQNISYLP